MHVVSSKRAWKIPPQQSLFFDQIQLQSFLHSSRISWFTFEPPYSGWRWGHWKHAGLRDTVRLDPSQQLFAWNLVGSFCGEGSDKLKHHFCSSYLYVYPLITTPVKPKLSSTWMYFYYVESSEFHGRQWWFWRSTWLLDGISEAYVMF